MHSSIGLPNHFQQRRPCAARIKPCKAGRHVLQPCRAASSNALNGESTSNNSTDRTQGLGATGVPERPRTLLETVQQAWKEAWEVDVEAENRTPEEEVAYQRERLRQQLQKFKNLGQQKQEGASTTASTSVSPTASSNTDASSQAAQQPSPQQVPGAVPIYKRPLLTWAVVAWTWVLLVQQWLPLLPALMSPAGSWVEWVFRAAGVCLIIPDTPAAQAWQMDVWGVYTGGAWTSALSAMFLHSGLLLTWLFTRGLLELGDMIEAPLGPLVMAWNLLLAALGAALAFSRTQAYAPAAITGPAVVCGLHMALTLTSTLAMHWERRQPGGVQQQQQQQQESPAAQQQRGQASDSFAVAVDARSNGSGSSRRDGVIDLVKEGGAGMEQGGAELMTGASASVATSAGTVNGSTGETIGAEAATRADTAAVDDGPLIAFTSRTGVACMVGAVVLGAWQPMLGLWSIAGACAGSLVASFTSVWAIAALRTALLGALWLLTTVVLWGVKVPKLLLQWLLVGARAAWLLLTDLVASLRKI